MKNLKQIDKKIKAELLTGRDYWHSQPMPDSGKEISFSDGPSGLRVQKNKADNFGLNKSEPATCFPSHSSLACSWDLSLIEKVGELMGEEAAHYGVNVLLAPGINIKRSPLCGRNFEYFSEDPYLSGKCGGAFTLGLQSTGVGACIKHYAANNKEYGRMVSNSVLDERTLREIYLSSFEIAVKMSEPCFVMTSYNLINGVYCNENRHLISDILRGEWGFEGAVVSDWGGTHNRVAAIKAGADIEMPGCPFSTDEILLALESGKLKESQVDDCVERLIKTSERLQPIEKECDFNANSKYAEYCAEQSTVMLKNDGTLPLNREQKVAIIGEFAQNRLYQGLGSSHVNPTSLDSITNLIKLHGTYIGFEKGYFASNRRSKLLIRLAKRQCADADVILLFLGSSVGAHEGMDRSDYSLPRNQIELLTALAALNKKIVVVLASGSPIDMSWDGFADSLLYVGLNGQGGAAAILNVLYGKVNPSGKVAETILNDFSRHRADKYFSVNAYYTIYAECMKVGYRASDDDNVKYPFGYGLSYTEFLYSDIEIVESGVKFKIKNVGQYDGSEVAQLYIGYPSNAHSPKRQLKGFSKVNLKCGEEREVFIPFDEYSFRSYDPELKKWVVVKGVYKVLVGSSSRDICLFGTISREGVEGVKVAYLENVEEMAITKKKRVTIGLATPFGSLTKSHSLFVRLFAKLSLFFTKGNPTVGGSLAFAPIRMGAQFLHFNVKQAEGMLDVFNGKYVRGFKKMIRNRQSRLDRLDAEQQKKLEKSRTKTSEQLKIENITDEENKQENNKDKE